MNGEATITAPILEIIIKNLYEETEAFSSHTNNLSNSVNRLDDWVDDNKPEKALDGAEITKDPISVIDRLQSVLKNVRYSNGELEKIQAKLNRLV